MFIKILLCLPTSLSTPVFWLYCRRLRFDEKSEYAGLDLLQISTVIIDLWDSLSHLLEKSNSPQTISDKLSWSIILTLPPTTPGLLLEKYNLKWKTNKQPNTCLGELMLVPRELPCSLFPGPKRNLHWIHNWKSNLLSLYSHFSKNHFNYLPLFFFPLASRSRYF